MEPQLNGMEHLTGQGRSSTCQLVRACRPCSSGTAAEPWPMPGLHHGRQYERLASRADRYVDDPSDSSLSTQAPKWGHLSRSLDKPIRPVRIGPESFL